MSNFFKKAIDRNIWAQVAPAPNAHAAAVCMCSDLRSDVSRNPFIYQLVSNAICNRFNFITKSWQLAFNPGLGGTFGAGAATCFVPSFGLQGTLAAGSTSTVLKISNIGTAPGVNMLANRGGSGELGFKIRVTDTTAGKVEERFIVANDAVTATTIEVDKAFSFTPATGARWEMLGGRVINLGASTLAAATWRSFEITTNVFTNLTNTNLPATIGTDSNIIVLDEQYTPYDCEPGEGMIRGSFLYDSGSQTDRYALTATGSALGTLTGQASGGDASVVANEYRNFQIRIVQDTGTPAAVGQRRIIASHTAGASPVYTLGSNWSTTPSASAKYVIELPNLVILRSTATTTQYVYNYTDATINNGTNSISANAWSTTYFGVAPAVHALGLYQAPAWGIRPDNQKFSRQSHIFSFRGGATATCDVFDIAGGTTGAWTNAITYDGANNTISTGMSAAYAPVDQEGRFHYFNIYVASQINQIYRFDAKNRVLSPYTPTDFLQSGTAALGNRLACYAVLDDDDKHSCVLLMSHLSTVCQELLTLV